MGYTHLRSYVGGIAEWSANGLPVERGPARSPAGPPRAGAAKRLAISGHRFVALVDTLAARSVGQILASWLAMVVAFGVLYWLLDLSTGNALHTAGRPVPVSLGGFATALYFSFVTATSVGYGDVVPVGVTRILAIIEAATGLLIFGFVISKFLSRRQDETLQEIHRIAFEDRLGRVQTNLHLVLAELQTVASDCARGDQPAARTRVRGESAAMVLVSELRTIHDLLYRPQQEPGEEVLEGILVNLAAVMQELAILVECMPAASPSASLQSSLRRIERLASEICGECVPRAYAPALKDSMDRVQATAGRIAGLRS